MRKENEGVPDVETFVLFLFTDSLHEENSEIFG